MDPRHPELAISRMGELINQYDDVLRKIRNAYTSAALAGLEREGGLVVQEICLVAPRLHEAMMQASRNRRHDIAIGISVEHQDTLVENSQEKCVNDAPKELEKCEKTEVKPKKKKTTKKKAKK